MGVVGGGGEVVGGVVGGVVSVTLLDWGTGNR